MGPLIAGFRIDELCNLVVIPLMGCVDEQTIFSVVCNLRLKILFTSLTTSLQPTSISSAAQRLVVPCHILMGTG